ncbi:hypothetical protein A3306_05755 [Rickettsia bellii]|uniref:Phage host specificity protein n=1 Tax=Rickettsia bellii (strain RML369-C) TaxID=336407 RepID=Q1RIU7_RICBR|nr:unknown [Rickettsia bellii RML369-C]ABV79216.1 hypothetical protein A1I_04365 [Rickettsia bellii OSU 85-389]ARD86650.1 hypothetical protein A3306_05755 [Rickettsia bellii]
MVNMFGSFFSSFGGAIGNAFGGGIFSSIGRFAGKMLGEYLDQLNHEPEEYDYIKNFKESFKYVTANYGEPIPLIFGTTKVSGKIIWADKVKEIANSTRHKEYFPYFHNVNLLRLLRNIAISFLLPSVFVRVRLVKLTGYGQMMKS